MVLNRRGEEQGGDHNQSALFLQKEEFNKTETKVNLALPWGGGGGEEKTAHC